jgi:hypothetical protein
MELFPTNGTTSNKGHRVEVVPFGKYKGQPVEVLQQDPQYVEWLQGQDWFRQRHQNIYTIIVNNFGEPDDSPEHNALQAMFLSDDLCKKVVKFAHRSDNINEHIDGGYRIDDNPIVRKFEVAGFDLSIMPVLLYKDRRIWSSSHTVFIEIKPVLGDNYPSVIRQIKGNASAAMKEAGEDPDYGGGMNLKYVCVCKRIDASSVDPDSVLKIFKESGILIYEMDPLRQ